MKQQDYNEDFFFSYLLSELSQEEEERIEQQYLDNEEFFNQLLVAEDDLIDRRAAFLCHLRENFKAFTTLCIREGRW